MADLVAYCILYEFEDLAAALTGADLLTPSELTGARLSRVLYRLTRRLSGSRRLSRSLRFPRATLSMGDGYELFLLTLNHPHELFALTALPGWRRRCRKAICYIVEAWNGRLPEHLLELLADFDHIFLGVSDPTAEVARITGRPCSYLPPAVDSLAFCPYPQLPRRAIDVCGIGRRSETTHAALLELARRSSLFYYYDTVRLRAFERQMTFHVSEPREHRLLLANLLKRSRYFIANRARANEPELTRGKNEIASRFFEGAAAGTVMLGEPPDTAAFRTHFGWPDAVIPTPFDSPRIAELITGLEADPLRCARVRRENVVQSLLRHDWVYRLRAMMEAVGIAPNSRLREREALLSARADEVRRSSLEAWS